MIPQTLFEKLWDSHAVQVENDRTTLPYIDRHLISCEMVGAAAIAGHLVDMRSWRQRRST